MINLRDVPIKTWVRIIALFLILLNQISISLFEFQLLPFSDESIYEGVSTVLTIVVSVLSAWYNNSFTAEAQLADEQLKLLKKGSK